MAAHVKCWVSVSDVDPHNELCGLVTLDHFTNSAAYVSEQKVTTASEAAVQDNVLLISLTLERLAHMRTLVVRGNGFGANTFSADWTYTGRFKRDHKYDLRSHGLNTVKSCNYCHEEGHLKADFQF